MTELLTIDQTEKNIIDYIKQARLKKGITQKQLAEIAGISTSLINLSEIYRRKYSKSTKQKLFKALDIDITDIKKISYKNIFDRLNENKESSQGIDKYLDLLIGQTFDLFPDISLKYKLKFLISDRFIDNAKDINNLQFSNKGNLLIDERQFYDSFREDFKINGQNYYAVILNDDSLVPVAFKGDYLIIKYLDNFNYSDFFIKEDRKEYQIPKLFILENPNNDKLVRYIKIIHDYTYKKNLFYAFLYLSEKYETDKYARLVGSDFYFKQDEIKIIGEVIAAIKSRPTVISFNE